MSNRYGSAAVDAVKLIQKDKGIAPREAWDKALSKYCATTSYAFSKGCPRDAFLGLCEEGMIKRVPAGNFTRSILNKGYAVKAVEIIKSDDSMISNLALLWRLVISPKKISHNSQMNVVVELWKNDLLA